MAQENGLATDTRLFWVGLTIWGALFGTGAYVAIEHQLPGVLMALIGLVGLLFLIRDRIKKTTMRFNLLLGASMVTWALFGYVIYDRYHPIGNHELIVIVLTASVAIVGIGLVLIGASQGGGKVEIYLGSARHWEARCNVKEEELKKSEARVATLDDQILTRLDAIKGTLQRDGVSEVTGKPDDSREYPWSAFTLQEKYADLSSDINVTYKDKVRMILTNATGKDLNVWTPTWKSQEVHAQHPFGSALHLYGPAGWKVKGAWGDGQPCITLPAGGSFMCWVGLIEPFGEGIKERLKKETTGAAIFPVKIEGKLYEVPIKL